MTLLYIVIGGVVIIVVVYMFTRTPAAPAAPVLKGAKITDYDECTHSVDGNGFITCSGSSCTGKQKCTLQRRVVGVDPWKDVDPTTTDNDSKQTRYEFRCICK